MLELKLPTEEQLRAIYERDLIPAFPPSERKPLDEMLREWKNGEYRPWCLFDGEEIVGEGFVYTHTPGFALFDYLCVTETRRNGGLGAAVVRKLAEAERGEVLFGEAEIPSLAPDVAMAERRLGFYRRCGAKRADYDSVVFGVPYHTLYWADGPVDMAALAEAHRAAYRDSMPEPVFRKYITIPWTPSMGLPEKTDWWKG